MRESTPWPGPAYRPPDPREVYGPADLVLRFRSVEEDRLELERLDAGFVRRLEQLAPSPPRGDKSPRAKAMRARREAMRRQHREDLPHVGGRIVTLKRNQRIKIRGRGRKATRYIGHTALLEAFLDWAIPELEDQVAAHPAGRYPVAGRVHLPWRYVPPDLEAYPDHPGVYETVCDLVQHARGYEDDVLVAYDDWSLIEAPDPLAPRLEIWVRPVQWEAPPTRRPRAWKPRKVTTQAERKFALARRRA